MTISRRTFGLSAICAAGSFASVSTVRATEQSSGIATADLPQGENATPALVQSIESAVAAGQPRLQLPEGEFHFWPEGTAQRFLHISNNDDEVNNVVVLLDGVDNFHIEGQNTRLIFHGRVTPFVLLNCSDVQITGVTIDWEVPFHCEATVSKVSPDGKQVELDFHEGFSFKVKDNEFYFAGEGFEAKGIKNILEFDAEPGTRFLIITFTHASAESVGDIVSPNLMSDGYGLTCWTIFDRCQLPAMSLS